MAAGAGSTALGRYHGGVWGIRSGSMHLRRIAPVWVVLASTAAGLLVGLALMEHEKPWLVLDTGLALAALTGAFAALREWRQHAQREVDRIFTLSPDPIAIVGPNGYFVRVNPAFAHLLGYTAAELRSRPVFDFIHPEDHERSLAAGRSLHEVGQVVRFENQYVCKDASLKWLEWTVTLAPDGAVYAAARDVSERRDRDREQASLRRIATLVARDAPPGEVFDAVAMEVGKLLDTDITVVGRYDGDGAATAIGCWSASPGGVPVGTRSVLGGRNVLTLVAETEKPARVDGDDDASGEAGDIARRYGWRSSIAAPIIVEGRLWGVMVVATQRPEPFPAGAERRLAAFMDLVSTAVANAQAQDEVRRFGDEQAALGRVATLVAAGAAPERVFAAVVEEVSNLLGLERIELVRYNGDATGSVIAASGEHPFPAGSTWSLDDPSVMATVARTRRAARIDDYSTLNGEIARTARDAGFQSAIGAPMTVEGRLWGVIIAISTDPEPIPERSKARLGQFTDLVATAVANAEARHALERVAAEQAALRRVATLVADGTEPDQLFAAVADEVRELFGAKISTIVRFQDDGTVVAVGAGGDFPSGRRWPTEGTNVVWKVLQTGRPARLDDYSAATDPIGVAMREAGITSAVGSPIIVEGHLWGVMRASSTELMPPGAEARLASFTELVATAIANAESRAELAASRRRIVAASDDARRRIERDLHDGVQQQLVSLGLELGAMKADPPTGAALQEQLTSVTEDVGTVFDALVEIARGIHPAILSQGGLAAALKALGRRSAVPVELHAQIDGPLPDDVEVVAYYVAAEALTNAVKHACASVLQMDVTTDDAILTLRVRDDGVGGADPGGGSGLVGLQDRVEALGGTITIDSTAGLGTCVVVSLPVATDVTGCG
jgi:PAS domain S-box-containing protein